MIYDTECLFSETSQSSSPRMKNDEGELCGGKAPFLCTIMLLVISAVRDHQEHFSHIQRTNGAVSAQ
jgi:hypothetical protein